MSRARALAMWLALCTALTFGVGQVLHFQPPSRENRETASAPSEQPPPPEQTLPPVADAPTENNPDLPKKAKWLGTKAGYLVARDEAVAVKLGYPHEDPSLRLDAMRQMGQQRAQQAASPVGTGPAAAAAVIWTELGPAPIPNG